MMINPLALGMIPSAIILVILGIFSLSRRKAPGAIPFILLLSAMFIYTVGNGLEIANTSLAGKLFWLRCEYIGIIAIPALWMVLTLIFSGHKDWLNRPVYILIFFIPAITLIVNFTNSWHHLYYNQLSLDTSGSYPLLSFTPGPWYIFYGTYLMLSFVGGGLVAISRLISTKSIYRPQLISMLVSVLGPISAYIMYVFDINPIPNLDIVPYGFTFAGVVMTWGIFNYRMLGLVPVARDQVVSCLNDGVLVLDKNNHVVDYNQSTLEMLRLQDGTLDTQPVEKVLSAWPELINLCRKQGEIYTEMNILDRYLDIQLAPLIDSHQNPIGKLLQLKDVTEFKRAEDELRALFSAMDDIVIVYDRNGRYLRIAPTNPAMYYRPPENMLGKTMLEVLPPDKANQFGEIIQQVLDSQAPRNFEYNLDLANGEAWFSATVTPLSKERVFWIARDITARKKAEQDMFEAMEAVDTANTGLRASLHRLELLNDLSRTLNSTLDLAAVLPTAVRQASELLAGAVCLLFMQSEAGFELNTSFPPGEENISSLVDKINQGYQKPGAKIQHVDDESGCRLMLPLKVGEVLRGVLMFYHAPGRACTAADQPLAESISLQMAATVENALLFQEIQLLAQTDSLTGVLSRRHFTALADHEFKYAVRYGRPLSILMLDIDHFKRVNDRFGHPAGDVVLKEMADCIQDTLRGSDLVGRYGGEEFIMLLPTTGIEEAFNAAERVRQRIAELKVDTHAGRIQITVSLGAAEVDPLHDTSLQTVIQRADTSMYIAKKSGRNMTVTQPSG